MGYGDLALVRSTDLNRENLLATGLQGHIRITQGILRIGPMGPCLSHQPGVSHSISQGKNFPFHKINDLLTFS